MKLQVAVDKLKHKSTDISTIVNHVFYNIFEFFKADENVEAELKELWEEEKLYFQGKLQINF